MPPEEYHAQRLNQFDRDELRRAATTFENRVINLLIDRIEDLEDEIDTINQAWESCAGCSERPELNFEDRKNG